MCCREAEKYVQDASVALTNWTETDTIPPTHTAKTEILNQI